MELGLNLEDDDFEAAAASRAGPTRLAESAPYVPKQSHFEASG